MSPGILRTHRYSPTPLDEEDDDEEEDDDDEEEEEDEDKGEFEDEFEPSAATRSAGTTRS